MGAALDSAIRVTRSFEVQIDPLLGTQAGYPLLAIRYQ
jgi:hypothetical protein